MTRRQVADGVFQREYGTQLPDLTYTDSNLARHVMSSHWKLQGLCADREDDSWFDIERSLAARRARATCFACPMQRRCLAAALVHVEEFGIWGGLSPNEREPLVRAISFGRPVDVVVDAVLDRTGGAHARAS